jgi:transposase
MVHWPIAASVQLDQPFRMFPARWRSNRRVWSLHEACEMLVNFQILRRGRLSRRRRFRMNTLEELRVIQEFRSFKRGFGFGLSGKLWHGECTPDEPTFALIDELCYSTPRLELHRRLHAYKRGASVRGKVPRFPRDEINRNSHWPWRATTP